MFRLSAVAGVMFTFTFLGALPVTVSAKNLCLQLSDDGSTLVLVNFKIKKGGASPIGGWTSGFAPHGSTGLTPLSGEAIATSDGQHVGMGLTVGGGGFVRCPDGTLCGGGTGEVRVFHSIRLDAGSDGKIGDGASGTDSRFAITTFGSNTDQGTASLTISACPKDLAALGLP